MDVRVGLWRKLSAEELMLLNCGVREDSWECLGLHADPTLRSVLGAHWKDWCWSWNSDKLARVDSLEKTLMLAGIGGRRRRDAEDAMAGWHHQLDGHEFEWTLGVGDGQGGLARCDSWGRKESDTNDQLNWTEFSIHNWKTVFRASLLKNSSYNLSILILMLLEFIFLMVS